MAEKNKITSNLKTRFRVIKGKEIALGPGKVALLEAIEKKGSISSAAKNLGLSYRRAWDMVDTMNRSFNNPLVLGAIGGKKGGGSILTPTGKQLALAYRKMEKKAMKAVQKEWKTIEFFLKP
jgi:molybdate transport system regulatory protein|tara:strand:+ start:173 stop:538 length:366 start_codon:yes stop_codon:yes gene_type:complete